MQTCLSSVQILLVNYSVVMCFMRIDE